MIEFIYIIYLVFPISVTEAIAKLLIFHENFNTFLDYSLRMMLNGQELMVNIIHYSE